MGNSLNGNSVEDGKVAAVATQISLLPNCSCTDFEPICDCGNTETKDTREQFRIWQPEGLFGKPTYNPGELAALSDVRGAWMKGDGNNGNTLSVTITAGSLAARAFWKFSFALRNTPDRASIKPKISIADQYLVPIVSNLILNGTVFASSDTPRFLGAWIRDDSNVLSAQSNITLSLSTNCPLISLGKLGATVTISGLSAYQTPSGILTSFYFQFCCPLTNPFRTLCIVSILIDSALVIDDAWPK